MRHEKFSVVYRGYALNWNKEHTFCETTVTNQAVGYYPEVWSDAVMIFRGDDHKDQVAAYSRVSTVPVHVITKGEGTIRLNVALNAIRRQIIHIELNGKWYDRPILWRLKRDYRYLNDYLNAKYAEMSERITSARKQLEGYMETVPDDNRHRTHGYGYVSPPKTPMIYESPFGVEVWEV